ncbi:NADP-dependent phosphogluconate dehydrogenase [Pseudomethylobacillus aquaticus]|uniref:6-phosphogluconate dehydrogenase, decarboxylating n=1 Tax=Pseudomethylobacillus aquaticus TaxID=2676064 RepID=A0A3N0V2J9_9PROT|nr:MULTISPECIES: NADP-dependent phosphogluconate dehydrogenase [Methylophilaceae]ROH87037.1 NADP-dependent phosphogluconate dehydrogenase [Pseudomethylobacillus aquaticus]
MKTDNADIGLVGLAVMGQNLALNIADHGYNIAVFNRDPGKTRKFIEEAKQSEPSHARLLPFEDLASFVLSIKRPRKIVLLVKAGSATDVTINALVPFLEQGDIIIDGGNSLWTDTIRREKELRAKGIEFIGSGVSGGETGARFGPSLMPSGTRMAWASLEPIWRDIAAKVDAVTGEPLEGAAPGKPIEGGFSCTEYIGPDGAGHYVKMVHNGIEYIDMQLICEAYWLMKNLLGMEADEIGKVFEEWNQGELSSFLIEITGDILQQKDPVGPGFLVDKILDTAGQKGTGQWTAANALELGAPANAIAAAVYARALSSVKEERVEASKILKGPVIKTESDKQAIIEAIKNALYCSKICAYAQGFQLMDKAQVQYNWKLNFGEIAQIWRGGCIIRARFLQKITDAYALNSRLKNLMLDPYFTQAMNEGQEGWRKVIALAVTNGIPAQGFSAALAYYDGYRSAVLPANLLQGQRDYFGAHTFERVDQPRGKFFHVDWPDPARPQLDV